VGVGVGLGVEVFLANSGHWARNRSLSKRWQLVQAPELVYGCEE
jgi:hypothetical protein